MRSCLVLAAILAVAAPSSAFADGSIAIDGGAIAVPVAGPMGIRSFRGIAYAAAPVGQLRWRPPAPLAAWQGVRPTDNFGADCVQRPSENNSPPARPRSEDCLYLNVWTGAARGAKLPVFVWFHGGGSRVGSGAEPQFDGTALAAKGMIVVTVNYRLGPLGFVSMPGLTAESGYRASGNYGFLDQIAALQWVRRNIAALGGDPAKVTIAGESSGSVSTGTLMASPLARGLFAQVIGESGSVFRALEYGSMGARSLADEERKGLQLADKLGTRDLAQLRAKPAEAILAASEQVGTFYNLPVVDGHVLPASPAQLFAQHRSNDVPLLVGWNSDEGSLQGVGVVAPLPQMLQQIYGAQAAKIAPFYPATGPDDVAVRARVAGDDGIAFSAWTWAMAAAKFGTHPVYVYQFDRAPPLPAGAFGPKFDVALAGAYHGAEISYVFDTLPAHPKWAVTDADRRVAAQMSTYWANFIKTGNPNGAGLPAWPVYDPVHPRRMAIGLTTGAVDDPDYARFVAIRAARRQIDPPEPVAPQK